MLLRNLRYALRMLRNNPAFATIAVLSLALGIGANSAMFSFADALVLRPLPVARPGEIVTLSSTAPDLPGTSFGSLSAPDYRDFRDRSRSFEGLVAFAATPVGVADKPDASPELGLAMVVSGNFFSTMGVEPALGRSFSPQEDRVPGRDAVLVLGHDFWEKHLGSDPGAIGRKLQLNGVEFTVIGVAPERFTGMDTFVRPGLFVPLAMLPRIGTEAQAKILEDRGARLFEVKGRLKAGVTLQRAEAELSAIARSLEEAHPDTNRKLGVRVLTEVQMRAAQSPPNSALAALLMGTAGLVLLIACANVANLLLSRARARSREVAVRLALGAGRGQLVSQFLTESLLLALAGGAAGLLLAVTVVDYLSTVQFPTDMPVAIHVELDSRVLIFSLIASVVSVFLFGLGPAIRSSRTSVAAFLKSQDANAGRRRMYGRNLLVIAQVALSLMLLTAATMFFQAFRQTLLGSPGFRTDHLLVASFDPALVRDTPEKAGEFYRTLVERARQIPGVRNAAITQLLPFGNRLSGREIVPEGAHLPSGKTADSVFSDIAGDRYFETMGTPMVAGRGFLPADTESSPRVAVINEVLAQRYWPKRKAVGKRFRLGQNGPWIEIVGVAQTAKYVFVGEGPLPYLYLPYRQNPEIAMSLIVQTAGDAASAAGPMREAVRFIDPQQPVFDVRTMHEYYQQRAVNIMEMIVVVVGAMGIVGLCLALVGLYGLVAYSVSRRTREIGIRMAIGAEWRDILGLVLRQGLVLAAIGVAAGMAGSLGLMRVLAALFARTSTHWVDAWGFIAMPIAVLAVTLTACYMPARRAAAIDANQALHYE
ncbi:MAG: ABC transporter permease [Bryobacteraceae bacterium]